MAIYSSNGINIKFLFKNFNLYWDKQILYGYPFLKQMTLHVNYLRSIKKIDPFWGMTLHMIGFICLEKYFLFWSDSIFKDSSLETLLYSLVKKKIVRNYYIQIMCLTMLFCYFIV